MKRVARILLSSILITILYPGISSAKDLRGRFGIGFNNQFSSLSSFSLKYGLPVKNDLVNIQLQTVAGLSLLEGIDDTFFFGGRLLYAVLCEDNLNLFLGFGTGYARFSYENQAIRIQPLMGTEFFLFGLENLGFSLELGLTIDLGDYMNIYSTSGSFASVGAHYYF